MATDGCPWLVLTNPRAGGAAGGFDVFAAARYASHGLGREIRVFQTNRRVNLTAVVRRAVAAGCGRIIVHGGDGTLRAAGQALAGTEVELAVLPGGTFNHFARNLGIPLDAHSAWETAMGGRVVHVNVGIVNGHVFLNNSSLGIYPNPRPAAAALGRAAGQDAGRCGRAGAHADRLRRAQTGDRPRRAARPRADAGRVHRQQPLHRRPDRALAPAADGRGRAGRARHPGQHLPAVGEVAGRVPGPAQGAALLREFATEALEIRSRRQRLAVSLDGETLTLQPPLSYRTRPRTLAVVVPNVSEE